MNIYFYPALFTYHSSDNSYVVEFIDFKGSMCAKTLPEAYSKAQCYLFQYLSTYISGFKNYPTATIPYSHIKLKKNQFISLIEVDLLKCKNVAIKKTLTIPMWLNELAEEHNINFSQLLQKALKEELKINY